MPVYEYHCDACGKEFEELLLTRSAEVDIRCHDCGSDAVTKLMSTASSKMAASSSMAASCPISPQNGGGCHGGGCGCH